MILNNNPLVESLRNNDLTVSLEEIAQVNLSLGDSFFNSEEYEKAIKYYLEAIEIVSELLTGFNRGGSDKTAVNDRQPENKITEIKGRICLSYEKLGDRFFYENKIEKARSFYNDALTFDELSATVINKIGLCLKKANKFEQASEAFNRAIRINSDFAEPYRNIADIFNFSKNDEKQAIEFYEKFIALNKENPEVFAALGLAFEKDGRHQMALDAFQAALNIGPALPDALSRLFITSLKIPGFSSREIFGLVSSNVDKFLKNLNPDDVYHFFSCFPAAKKLHIGYLAGDFPGNYIPHNLLAFLENHNPENFRVTCYTTTNWSAHLKNKSLIESFKDISALDDKAAAGLINGDQVDILVDLSGHSPGSRIFTTAYRPAPVQVLYPAQIQLTSGIGTVGYFFSDNTLLHEGDEKFFSEKAAFPESAYYFNNEVKLPEISPLPALKNDFITFAVIDPAYVLDDRLIGIYAGILQKVPGSRILIYRPAASETSLLEKFGRYGLEKDRIFLSNEFSLKTYEEIDILLDSFPLCTFFPVYEALFMGVPVVTLAGETIPGRFNSSVNRAFGLNELVAGNSGEFIETAVNLAADLKKLAELRKSLGIKARQLPVTNPVLYTANLEKEYRKIWSRFCREKNTEIQTAVFSLTASEMMELENLTALRSLIEEAIAIGNIDLAKQGMNLLLETYKGIGPDDLDTLDFVLEEILFLQGIFFTRLAKTIGPEEYRHELAGFEKNLFNEIVTEDLYNQLLFDFGKKLVENGKPEQAIYYFDIFLDRTEDLADQLDQCARIGDLFLDRGYKPETVTYYARALEICIKNNLLTDMLVFLELLIDLCIELKKYKECLLLNQQLLDLSEVYNLPDDNAFSVTRLAKLNYIESNFKNIEFSDYTGYLIDNPETQLYAFFIKKLNEKLKSHLTDLMDIQEKLNLEEKKKKLDDTEIAIDEYKGLIFDILRHSCDISSLSARIFLLNLLEEQRTEVSALFIKAAFHEEIGDYRKSLNIIKTVPGFIPEENYDLKVFIKFYTACLYDLNGEGKKALSLYSETFRENTNNEFKLFLKFVFIYYRLMAWTNIADQEKIKTLSKKLIFSLDYNEQNPNFIFANLIEIINEFIKNNPI
jgi:protein O-GlcNAc transferase